MDETARTDWAGGTSCWETLTEVRSENRFMEPMPTTSTTGATQPSSRLPAANPLSGVCRFVDCMCEILERLRFGCGIFRSLAFSKRTICGLGRLPQSNWIKQYDLARAHRHTPMGNFVPRRQTAIAVERLSVTNGVLFNQCQVKFFVRSALPRTMRVKPSFLCPYALFVFFSRLKGRSVRRMSGSRFAFSFCASTILKRKKEQAA